MNQCSDKIDVLGRNLCDNLLCVDAESERGSLFVVA